MRARSLLLALCALTSIEGCSVLVDGSLSSRGTPDGGFDAGPTPLVDGGHDGGTDAGPMIDAGPSSVCAGQANGLHCLVTGIDEPFVCIDQTCQLSRCGDGTTDARVGSTHTAEACDDGNTISGDGCESDCTFSCTSDGQCDDHEACNGVETCSSMHACALGTMEPDTTACMVGAVAATCHAGVCRAGACPDGNVDPGEECDPATPAPNDGCNDDCTFTCTNDGDCADGDVCNGDEQCDTANHICSAATTPLGCDDSDACTTDTCDMVLGCQHASLMVDHDGDTHFAMMATCGGDDCNDDDANVYPGAPEACTATVDFNCDGTAGAMTTYYRDCDGDGFAASTTGSVMACTEPAAAGGCTGGWTTTAPTTTSTTDCLDTSVGATAHPGQTAYFTVMLAGLAPTFDYNCSTRNDLQDVTSTSSTLPPRGESTTCRGSGGRLGCDGDAWYVATSVPECGATAIESYCAGLSTCARTTHTVTVACH